MRQFSCPRPILFHREDVTVASRALTKLSTLHPPVILDPNESSPCSATLLYTQYVTTDATSPLTNQNGICIFEACTNWLAHEMFQQTVILYPVFYVMVNLYPVFYVMVNFVGVSMSLIQHICFIPEQIKLHYKWEKPINQIKSDVLCGIYERIKSSLHSLNEGY